MKALKIGLRAFVLRGVWRKVVVKRVLAGPKILIKNHIESRRVRLSTVNTYL